MEENAYADYTAWNKDWQVEWSGQFSVLGSRDTTAGNQSCQAAVSLRRGAYRLSIAAARGIGEPLPITGS
ncbi:hypothetical protein [Candidatus Methylacidithermus pantelleriae]|uniref:Uncharacterized protein n=1 Tax=Candidatus Methylacidithermus pantelleriae TaxID=2744239 RepID=A0A8J2FMY2_9BACT|nr:hypothetical protein [Candidatus Methylacidithermus pantelleriae]CAF0691462.1 hypothetical protein MPNT_100054 [Candidatus Methylacidithermus pantelleriae]